MKPITYTVALAVAAAITFGGLKPAYGELVFEDDLNAGAAVATDVASSAPAAVQARATERQDLTKSELMRRQRLREELKNEDLLTQKLEELRLKDEMKRTDQISGNIVGSGVNKQGGAADAMIEQRVGSAADVTSASSMAPSGSQQIAQAPTMNPALYNTNVGTNGAPVAASEAAISNNEDKLEDSSRVTVTPRAGTSSITNSMYDIEAKYAVGVGIGVDVTDYISFTGGYSYANYGVGAGGALAYPMGFSMANTQRVSLNDNVIDVGLRAHFLSVRSKVRPFIGGGGAYRKGYVNYDDQTLSFIKRTNPYGAQDVEISGFAGYIETGLEFKLTKSISLSGTFRYFNVLSSRQNNPLNPYGFVSPNGYGYYGYSTPYYGAAVDPYYGNSSLYYNGDTRAQASDALAKNNFYQIMAGIAISF